jgi:hypothetical protein
LHLCQEIRIITRGESARLERSWGKVRETARTECEWREELFRQAGPGSAQPGLFIIIILTQKVAKRRIPPPQRDTRTTHSLSRSLKVQYLFWCVGDGERLRNDKYKSCSSLSISITGGANCFCKPDMDMRFCTRSNNSLSLQRRCGIAVYQDGVGIGKARIAPIYLAHRPSIRCVCMLIGKHTAAHSHAPYHYSIFTPALFCAVVCKKITRGLKNSVRLY